MAKILKTVTEQCNVDQQTHEDHSPNSSQTSAGDEDFERSLENECSSHMASTNSSDVDLKIKLLSLANSKQRMDSKTDVLKLWESKRYDDIELYMLATTALAVPCTQVSVERCFSGLKLLLEDHRLRLSPSKLDDLMIIRFNINLLHEAIARLGLK